jgi:hypothetical protein
MSVRLEAVEFNHDPTGATTDALTIRRNASQTVAVPEWRRGVSLTAADAPAAYAMAGTAGRTRTVRVQLRRLDPALGSVEIRALDARGAGGCLYALLRALGINPIAPPADARGSGRAASGRLRSGAESPERGPGNVLGSVRARTVAFRPDDLTDFELFELANVRVESAGVGVFTDEWRWQYRTAPAQPWMDFETTTHEVFVLLASPTAPWQQQPATATNTQLPWTEVLRHACAWAAGAHTPDDAAERITRAVYELGPVTVEYDCPGGGSTRYAFPAFNATAFLERLAGGIGNGKYVNCSDCATIAATFANALGCDLWQSRMGHFFALNPLLAIGSSTWQTACNWGSFAYHEVAWKDACTAADAVYDACLQVDGDMDPTAPPHSPLLPVDMRFGDPGDGDYRDRLATPAGRASCSPQPATRQRRTIF